MWTPEWIPFGPSSQAHAARHAAQLSQLQAGRKEKWTREGPDNVTKAKAHARREPGMGWPTLAGEMPQREEDAWEPCFSFFFLRPLCLPLLGSAATIYRRRAIVLYFKREVVLSAGMFQKPP